VCKGNHIHKEKGRLSDFQIKQVKDLIDHTMIMKASPGDVKRNLSNYARHSECDQTDLEGHSYENDVQVLVHSPVLHPSLGDYTPGDRLEHIGIHSSSRSSLARPRASDPLEADLQG
jgi:hypothetical protein